MRQLELAGLGQAVEITQALDRESQELLDRYRNHRVAEGASPRTVAREISQVRSVAREGIWHGRTPLVRLFTDIPCLATVLCEPRQPIARSTGMSRFVAVQRFISFIAPLLGRKAHQDRCDLDQLLPAQASPGWHSAGVVVAGRPDHRRHRHVSLSWNDLERMVEAAGDDGSEVWHRALVMLHCFTGLRPEEIVTLRWNALERTTVPMTDELRFSIAVHRGERVVVLPLIPKVAAELAVFASSLPSERIQPAAFLFPSARSAERPISYRTARYVVTHACREAGVPVAEASDLRAAFAFGLKLQGLSDHQVAAVLGLARVRSLDRLLARHRALPAQRAVREIIDTV